MASYWMNLTLVVQSVLPMLTIGKLGRMLRYDTSDMLEHHRRDVIRMRGKTCGVGIYAESARLDLLHKTYLRI
jgi:hypothetical protein